MADIKLTTFLTSIADAIRYAEGSTDKIAVSDFADRIKVLSSQPGPTPGPTPTPGDIPEKIFRDTTIIPDMYNTGHSGILIPWNEAYAYLNTTLTWRENTTWLDFNNGKCLKNVADNTTFVFEDIDFSAEDTARFQIGNLGAYSESSTYFRRGIKFVFKNCKFGQLFMNQNKTVSDDDLSFEYDYCTFGNFGGVGLVTNCRIGGLNSEYANVPYRSTDLGNDLVKANNGSTFRNCYLYDLEYPTATQQEGHLDGLQVLYVDGLVLENVRIECFDFAFNSQGGWSYTLYLENSADNILVKDCVFSGGGNYGVAISAEGQNRVSENNKVSLYNDSAIFYPDTFSEGFTTTDSLYVTSIWHKEDEIQIVCTNETMANRTLRIVDNNGAEYTFDIGRLPKRNSEEANAIASWDELPFNRVFTIPAENVEWFRCYDGNELIRTWRVTDENQKGPGIVPQPTPTPIPENVPQSGTWQMKTTTNKGYLIIGKDDDTADQAMFVRMVNGYGWPVTINTTWDNAYNMASHKQTPDTDSAYSLYPSGSVSRAPDYCSVHDLNRIIIDNNLGEVAQHGLSAKNIWDSRLVTDEQIDYMYANYTSGGGTKSRSEFWDLFKSTYADCDAAQGASYAFNGRASLEADLGVPIKTVGCWGASGDREIEGIVVCPVSYLARGTYEYAREWNYWGDGPVTSLSTINVRNPHRITRLSGGLASVQNVESACDFAYENNACVEVFTHEFFKGYGSATEWSNFKSYMDKIKEYVDDGKIEVVTRYQYSQLGEYVDNPISSISVVADAFSYKVGDDITEANFTCKAFFNDGTFAICDADRILDISQVDSSQAGNYTVTLLYRGKKNTCTVVVENDIPIHDYILENKSYSGGSVATTTNICTEPDFVEELNKTYHFEFDFTADVSEAKFSTHYIMFKPASWGDTSQESEKLTTSVGTVSKHFSIEFVCNKSVGKADMFAIVPLNTTITSWAITNLYCWEVTE